MNLKWQWFLGGKDMFWVSLTVFLIFVLTFVFTYVIDPVTIITMAKQPLSSSDIKDISEEYVSNLGVEIVHPIKYRFVRYKDGGYEGTDFGDEVLLGTFHEWNGVYYIDISVDMYKNKRLKEVVVHETRHMLVEYMKDEKIINLVKYTEEIAEGDNLNFNELFNIGINLLKEKENGKI